MLQSDDLENEPEVLTEEVRNRAKENARESLELLKRLVPEEEPLYPEYQDETLVESSLEFN